jgi:rRNA maturation endonuclease Nob1
MTYPHAREIVQKCRTWRLVCPDCGPFIGHSWNQCCPLCGRHGTREVLAGQPDPGEGTGASVQQGKV